MLLSWDVSRAHKALPLVGFIGLDDAPNGYAGLGKKGFKQRRGLGRHFFARLHHFDQTCETMPAQDVGKVDRRKRVSVCIFACMNV